MEVHAKQIRAMREDRAWTQQHLADACGLSLRTVQRAENYGNCSMDTLQALASVLEVELTLLKLIPEPQSLEQSSEGKSGHPYMLWIGAALVIGFASGFAAALGLS